MCKNGVKLTQSFGQRGRTRLKNIGRLDLIHLIVTNGSNVRPSFTSANKVLFDLSPAPRADDHLWIAGNHIRGIHDSIFSTLLRAQLRKHGITAGDFDQLINPADAGDKRVVPLFKEHAWSKRKAGC